MYNITQFLQREYDLEDYEQMCWQKLSNVALFRLFPCQNSVFTT